MDSFVLSAVIFALMLGGILLGALLRSTLPDHHLSRDSQDTIRLGVGLIATMAALVVGLLIAAAKNSFDTQGGQIRQITADLILLDNLLAQYGPEAKPMRAEIRRAMPNFVNRLWHEKAQTAGPFEADASAEKIYLEIQALAAQTSTDLAQTRLLLFAESGSSIPLPFLGVLALWLIIIFASFSLFTSLNATVFISLSLFALSAAGAIFLVLELNDPFNGLLRISDLPLRNALAPLGS